MWDYPAPSGIAEERMRAAKPPYHVRGSGSEGTEKRNQSTRLFVFRWAAAKQEVAEMMMLLPNTYCATVQILCSTQNK